MKDGLGRPAISRLARNIERAWPAFDADGFVSAATRGLTRLELKARVAHVAEQLAVFLPQDYPAALEIIVASSEAWDAGEQGDALRGFAAWPLFELIERRGLEDFRRSMAALRAITHLFSAEFAIRPFIARYQARAFAELRRWTRDESEHVRRLVSEGCRPRLPWATRIPALIDDPSEVLLLLELLKDDPSLYVRRSVANNLNDIAKDHPESVIDRCETWLEGASPERRWVIERATRTLVKAAHPRVWALLGFTKRPKIAVSEIATDKQRLRVGDEICFTCEIRSTARSPQRVVVDYALHFVKANGQARPKVFKLKVLELAPGAAVEVSKRHSFRQISTRSYYPGVHTIEVLVNGVARALSKFELRPAR